MNISLGLRSSPVCPGISDNAESISLLTDDGPHEVIGQPMGKWFLKVTNHSLSVLLSHIAHRHRLTIFPSYVSELFWIASAAFGEGVLLSENSNRQP